MNLYLQIITFIVSLDSDYLFVTSIGNKYLGLFCQTMEELNTN